MATAQVTDEAQHTRMHACRTSEPAALPHHVHVKRNSELVRGSASTSVLLEMACVWL